MREVKIVLSAKEASDFWARRGSGCIHGSDCAICNRVKEEANYHNIVKKSAYKKRCEAWMKRFREIREAIGNDTNVDSHSDAQ